MRNHARAEVDAMNWDSYISDPEGDRLREVARLQHKLAFWRAFALLAAAAWLTYVLVLVLFGGS